MEGGELFDRIIDENYNLTELDTVLFIHQICEGLRYMHKMYILHLDLKVNTCCNFYLYFCPHFLRCCSYFLSYDAFILLYSSQRIFCVSTELQTKSKSLILAWPGGKTHQLLLNSLLMPSLNVLTSLVLQVQTQREAEGQLWNARIFSSGSHQL